MRWVDDLVDRGDGAGRAALDRVAHDAGAERGDGEGEAEEDDLHGNRDRRDQATTPWWNLQTSCIAASLSIMLVCGWMKPLWRSNTQPWM